MLPAFELVHITSDAIAIIVVVVGGVFALRALRLLYKNAETLEAQRSLWIPILTAGGLFVGSTLADATGDFLSFASEPFALLSIWLELLGFLFLTLAISRFYNMHKKYDKLKAERQSSEYKSRQ